MLYPSNAAERDRWIVGLRGLRNPVRADMPYAFLAEQERFADGTVDTVATIFLTNRECPWRCTMCDLWKNTLTKTVPAGAIPRQIAYALSRLPPARQIKLYNSGSFFDPRAIPPEDYEAVASLLDGFERVIVESHPALLGEGCLHFQKMLGAKLEVAIGLETAHPVALEKLNKRITLNQFARAADWLHAHQIALRTFLLVHPPFIPPQDWPIWLGHSIDFALHCQSTAIALIPTRANNGAVEQLATEGQFSPPTLTALEDALDDGLLRTCETSGRTRIFVDLWDLDGIARCAMCRLPRMERLRTINDSQAVVPRVPCSACGA